MPRLRELSTTHPAAFLRAMAAAGLLLALGPGSAQAHPLASSLAYIGPGAGFAAAGSVFILLSTFLLALGIVLIWPLKAAVRLVRTRGRKKAQVKRFVVLGLDGFDPELARRFMAEGRMPHLKALSERGCFHPLATACPSISPVSWSSYATGVDASRHNIYDFLTRDPCSYMPTLSSSQTLALPRTLNLGFARISLGKRAVLRFLQKSQPFWKLLGGSGVWSSIIRVPITFPPQKFKNGTLLSGMCVPDLQGTQGSFSFYSTKPRPGDKHIGGQQYQIRVKDGRVESKLTGPVGADGHPMKSPFSVQIHVAQGAAQKKVTITVGGASATVGVKEYTPWLVIPFQGVQGIARFYVQSLEGADIELYVTPIHIDPEKPAMPISHPFVYSIYLAKMQGPFATLGLAEDTWALNERVIDEEAFLKQAWLIFEERKLHLWHALEKTKKGFVTVVFDTSDRISHMFYRYLEPEHPANAGKDTERFKDVMPQMYGRMDELVGEALERIGPDPDTVLMVISDHGFTSFQRGVNLNTWLRDQGYLVLKEGAETSPDWFSKVDWSKTRAFTLGLTGVFINRVGREAQGIVKPGPELDALCRELKQKLEALIDPADGRSVIKEVFITPHMHNGPYADMAPELLIGYHKRYRHSWDCATGAVSKQVFSDNTKSWSGDHCVDPRLVPGVFWCNRKINTQAPSILDIAPTALSMFGIDPPHYMQGQSLFGARIEPRKIEKPSRTVVAT
jgi:predicted AlkP superfamily phosphohydrolase/phosphomutase